MKRQKRDAKLKAEQAERERLNGYGSQEEIVDLNKPHDRDRQIDAEAVKLTHNYKKYDIFPQSWMQDKDFKKFINGGYKRFLQTLAYDTYKVIKEQSRANDHIQIFEDYCQQFEMLAKKEKEFYTQLIKYTTISEDYTKGEIIEPDPTVVRILWDGVVEYDMPEQVRKKKFQNDHDPERFLPRHSLIVSDQFSDPILNLECFCYDKRCDCGER